MCSQYACTDTPSGWSRSSFLRGGVGFPNMVAVFLQLCCVRIDRASARLQFATVRLALIVEPSLLDFKASRGQPKAGFEYQQTQQLKQHVEVTSN